MHSGHRSIIAVVLLCKKVHGLQLIFLLAPKGGALLKQGGTIVAIGCAYNERDGGRGAARGARRSLPNGSSGKFREQGQAAVG